MLVALTDAGIARVEEACRAHVQKGFAFLKTLDAKERGQLADLLRKLLVGIERMHSDSS